jgi:hypothetical protein
MSLIKKTSKTERLCTFTEAGEILGISSESIRRKICGTESLTRVSIPGTNLKRLVFSEVIALRDKWIEAARNKSRRRRLELVA